MLKALRGMKDILPEEAGTWQCIEEEARKTFELYGYKEIRTPSLEETSLFTKSIGEGTDIVQKEMYSFKDKGGRKISLRPEATAPVVRAYLENNLDKTGGLVKLYYIGPMFRSERPQAGRQRQFHQIGVEALGSYNPYLDVEVINLMKSYLDSIGLDNCKIKLNSLGCNKDKTALKNKLKKFLSSQTSRLCKDCKIRFKKNILRVFDCKNDSCKALLREAPKMSENLCADCNDHFEKVKSGLELVGVNYEIDPYIVRGLDYYTRTTFEVTHPKLGAQDAIAAGGRYDNLVKDFGGAKTGACGFALGVERIITALELKKGEREALDVYIATIGEEPYKKGFYLLDQLRKEGISSEIDYESKSLKAQMRVANKLGVRFVAILGEDELEKGIICLRDMSCGSQEEIKLEDFMEKMGTLFSRKHR